MAHLPSSRAGARRLSIDRERDGDLMRVVLHPRSRPRQAGPRRPMRLLLALVLSLACSSAAACSGASDAPPGLRAGRAFDTFAVYWLGTRFERWHLTTLRTPARPD